MDQSIYKSMIEILHNHPNPHSRSPQMVALISNALATIPFFSSMTSQAIGDYTQKLQLEKYNPRTLLFKAGD